MSLEPKGRNPIYQESNLIMVQPILIDAFMPYDLLSLLSKNLPIRSDLLVVVVVVVVVVVAAESTSLCPSSIGLVGNNAEHAEAVRKATADDQEFSRQYELMLDTSSVFCEQACYQEWANDVSLKS
jgi:hypothetical protein